MAQLSSYDTPTRWLHLTGQAHVYRRHWWEHWRKRCDACGQRYCRWAQR